MTQIDFGNSLKRGDKMELIRFRVKDFRSIKDTGWIDAERVTALIGTNESGKTNILMPLWKMKPAKEGAIDPLLDYPRNRYHEIRGQTSKPVFVQAEFVVNEQIQQRIEAATNIDSKNFRSVIVSRDFDSNYYVEFPECKLPDTVQTEDVVTTLNVARSSLGMASPSTRENGLVESLTTAINNAESTAKANTTLSADSLSDILDSISGSIDTSKFVQNSTIRPVFDTLSIDLKGRLQGISASDPAEDQQVKDLVIESIPFFVYYSNYGNLDSEIYLPHVIENMGREDLGAKEKAKARTLNVLFEFVRLSPEEILELGRELPVEPNAPNQKQIDKVAKNKKERDVLLQSASTQLTRDFKDWWKQGEYTFRFAADGNHFRIWVSDDQRPENIELESRSSGLQWFLSFYLVFLVESMRDHRGAILLLDEPGVTLHPIAQRDLAKFFENLSITNQLMYTTHSPFLVDTDHLHRVRAVFVNSDGLTEISPDLRASKPKSKQAESVFPVHSALGLTVSDTLLHGCIPVIVEGPSDQYALQAFKIYLIHQSRISPNREIVFVPSGGVRGIKAVIPIISSTNTQLPLVVIDSDEQGLALRRKLVDGPYSGQDERIIDIATLIDLPGAEIEDLWPLAFITREVDRLMRVRDEDFESIVDPQQPIVPQIEAFGAKHGVDLETPGWKVELSISLKERLSRSADIEDGLEKKSPAWNTLFSQIISDGNDA